MASIVPWLQVTPRDYLSAAEAGARARDAAASLSERAQEAGQEQNLQSAKFQFAQQESAAERALRESLAKRQQDVANARFQQNLDLRKQAVDIRQQALELQRSKDAAGDILKTHATKTLADGKDDAAKAFSEWTPGDPIGPLVTKHPAAMEDKDFAAFVMRERAEEAAAARAKAAQQATKALKDEPVTVNTKLPFGSKSTTTTRGGLTNAPSTGAKKFTYDPDTGKFIPQ